jgi:hypothetical protein
MGEEFTVGLGFMFMLHCDAVLDLVELSSYPSVVFVAVSVQSGEGFEAFVRVSVVDEPAWGFGEEEDEGG